MDKRFDFHLSAGSLFPVFIAYWVPSAALAVLSSALSTRSVLGQTSPVWPSLLLTLIAALLYFILAIPILRIVVPAVSLDGSPFSFRGSIGRFFGINLLGLFLSIITVGVYLPWYIARVTRYLAGEAQWKEKGLEFKGTGGRLFVILLLTVVLPIVVIVVAVVIVAATVTIAAGGTPDFLGNAGGLALTTQIVVTVVMLLILSPYMYELYRWYLTNLRIGDYGVRWNTRFWPSVGFILLQVLLSIVTLSIYWPAAWIRGYRYFATRSEVVRAERVYASVGFSGTPAGGFGLFWGQTLLTVITLGIYFPWAAARIGRWVAGNTTLTTTEAGG